jgi:hypothetical protein
MHMKKLKKNHNCYFQVTKTLNISYVFNYYMANIIKKSLVGLAGIALGAYFAMNTNYHKENVIVDNSTNSVLYEKPHFSVFDKKIGYELYNLKLYNHVVTQNDGHVIGIYRNLHNREPTSLEKNLFVYLNKEKENPFLIKSGDKRVIPTIEYN